MPRLSKEQREEYERALAEDNDDGDDEVEIGLGEGKYFRGSYRRAKALGYVTEPESKDKGDSAANSDTAKRFTSGRRTG